MNVRNMLNALSAQGDIQATNPLANKYYLVYSGTGAAIYGQNGANRGLEDDPNFSFDDVISVIGTSGGSLTALTVSLGYTSDEAEKILDDFKMSEILDKPDLLNFPKDYGFFSADKIYKLVLRLLKEKVPGKKPAEVTFHDLVEAGHKNLYVYTARMILENDEPKPIPLVFSREYYGNTPVAAAILASISAPPAFKAVFMKESPTQDKKTGKEIEVPYRAFKLAKKRDKYTDTFTDGGICDNFPIHFFDKLQYLNILEQEEYKKNNKNYNPDKVFNPHILGITPIADSLFLGSEYKVKKQRLGIGDTKNFYVGMVNGATHGWGTQHMDEPEVSERTIEIRRDVPTFDFKRSEKTRAQQFKNGQDAVSFFSMGIRQTSNPDSQAEEPGEYLPAKTGGCLSCFS